MRRRLTTGSRIGASVLAGLIVGAGCAGKSEPAGKVEQDPLFKARMAQSLMAAGRVGEALSTLQEAIEADPGNAALRLHHGQICFQAGRYDEAERSLHKALQLDRYLTDAHNFLGAVYQETGRHEQAEREYKLALEDLAYPSPELVYLNLGILYADLGREEEAIEVLRKSVGVNPKYYKAHFQLASVLEKTGNYGEAVREYEVAEPGFRNNADYFYRLGLTYFRLGEKQRARFNLDRALSVAPGSESAARAEELLRMLD